MSWTQITQQILIRWYKTEIINRRTFVYLWNKHVYERNTRCQNESYG